MIDKRSRKHDVKFSELGGEGFSQNVVLARSANIL